MAEHGPAEWVEEIVLYEFDRSEDFDLSGLANTDPRGQRFDIHVRCQQHTKGWEGFAFVGLHVSQLFLCPKVILGTDVFCVPHNGLAVLALRVLAAEGVEICRHGAQMGDDGGVVRQVCSP